jgi:serine/threonine-protein kinase
LADLARLRLMAYVARDGTAAPQAERSALAHAGGHARGVGRRAKDSPVTGELRIGEAFGAYVIAGVAGSGGMGVVYRAEQRSLGRTVALKVIRPEIAGSGDYRARFLREARLAAVVDHPNVVTVFDVGEQAGLLYLAMQWVDGLDLRALLDAQHRLDPDRAVRIGVQVAFALGAVHEAGLIHRDVKPSNVLVRDIGGLDHAYLTDFGVAKMPGGQADLTRTGWVIGTSGYLSPEQIRGEEPGPRSDLYALGCVIFEALTGQRAFGGGNDAAVRWASASGPRPVASALCPALGRGYDAFLGRALAIDPQERFASGADFATALRAAQAGQDSSVPQVPSAADTPTLLAVQPDQEPPTMPERGPDPEPRQAGLLEPTKLRPARPERASQPPPAAAGRRREAAADVRVPRAAFFAQFIVAAVCLVFIVQVAFLTDYINNGDGWKSLLQSSSHDNTSVLNPADFWIPVVLAALAFVLCLIPIRRSARPTMIGVLIIALCLIGYTLYIPITAYPGFGMYGAGYWLSLAAAVAMAAVAAVAVTRRRNT